MTQRDLIKDRDLVDDIERASFSKETYQADAVRRGRYFQFTNRWTSVADAASVSVYLNNTGSGNQPITLVSPVFQSTGKCNIDIIQNPDSYGTGNSSSATIHNLKSDASTSASASGRYGSGVSISGGDTIEESIISGSGAGVTKVGGTSRSGILSYLATGDDVVVRATNTSGGTSDFGAVLGFIQELEGVPPQQDA